MTQQGPYGQSTPQGGPAGPPPGYPAPGTAPAGYPAPGAAPQWPGQPVPPQAQPGQAAPGYPAPPGYAQPGYPSQPPGGYPHPQPTAYPQQAPPHPGPPGYGPPAPGNPPAGRKGGRRGLLIGGIAAAVVLLLCAVGGVVVWQIADARSDTLQVAWTKRPAEERLTGSTDAAVNATWVTGDLVVRAATDGVVAFRLADGERAWTVPMPAGTRMCTASVRAAGDRGVIAYGGKRCDQVGTVDLKTGTLTGPVRVPPTREPAGRGTYRLQAAGDLAVLDDGAALTAIGLGDGAIRWRQEYGECDDQLWEMTEGRVVTERRCVSSGEESLVALDAATGKEQFQAVLGSRVTVFNVPSVDPLVAVAALDGGAAPVVVAVDGSGRKTLELSTEAEGRRLDVLGVRNPTSIDRPVLAARGDLLFAVDRAATPDRVMAFDLGSGKPKWTEQDNQGEAQLVRVDDEGVWAFEMARGDGHLVRIEPGSGEGTTVASADLTSVWSTRRGRQVYQQSGVVVLTALPGDTEAAPSLAVLR